MPCEQLVRRRGQLVECGRSAQISPYRPGRMCDYCKAKYVRRGCRTLLEWEEHRKGKAKQ